jgi:hypothetical protein
MELPEKYKEDEEIIRLTVEQIKKDFGTYLPQLDFSGNKSDLFNELSKQLSDSLEDIYKNHKTAFQALFYRVDITESVARKAMGVSFNTLADKIIQREFQKVLTKKYYSKK